MYYRQQFGEKLLMFSCLLQQYQTRDTRIAENGVCIWLESECTLLLHHLKTNARPC